jgi:zinc transport system permease protein
MNMFDFLTNIFVQRAFIAGTALAILAPLIGIFLVVKRLSYLSDTLAHFSLIGVTLSFVTRLNPILSALIASFFGSFLIEILNRSKKIPQESILVLFIAIGLSVSALIVNIFKIGSNSLVSYLFGSLSVISETNLYYSLILALIGVLFVLIFFKKLFLISLNSDLAKASGVKVYLYSFSLVILSAITVSVGIQVLGSLLIGSLITIPVLASMQYKLSFKLTILLSIFFSVFSIWLGIVWSYFFNIPIGACIVIINIMFFSFSYLLSKLI